jgi:DNA-binding beta-propeller fold protein YncE
MKSKIARLTLSLLMSLFVFAAASFAATKPQNEPEGLALDSKGNLYVANVGGNEVLVYNTNYQQLTGRTISLYLNGPTGVAFDPSGNLWVSNLNSSQIYEYSPTGSFLQQFPAYGINNPIAISIDGIGNLWVQNANNTLQLYSPSLDNQLLNSTTASNLQVGFFLGIATHGSQYALGTDQGFQWSPIDLFIEVADTEHDPVAGLTGNSLAFDAAGNLYVGNLDGTVDYYNVTTKTSTPFATLTYPKGIVVDNARGRVYISDLITSKIQVYSTSGTLLKTIQ